MLKARGLRTNAGGRICSRKPRRFGRLHKNCGLRGNTSGHVKLKRPPRTKPVEAYRVSTQDRVSFSRKIW